MSITNPSDSSRFCERSVPFVVERAEDHGDGLTLSGYAAIFDAPTEINSWEGNFTESIARGAFRKTIREKTPVLMFNHGHHPFIGDMPIGSINVLREDERGLYVEARLFSNALVEPVREAIAAGAIDGMSFRFAVTRDEWNKDKTVRTLREVKLAELGPVVFPAYPQTSVGVRSQQFVRELVADDTDRVELARALIFGVTAPSEEDTRSTDEAPSTDAATQGTSDAAPLTVETPAPATSRLSRSERLRIAAQTKGLLNHE